MSDTDSSGDNLGTAANQDEVQPLPLIRNPENAEKLEEFQKLLRSMMDSRAASVEEEDPQRQEQRQQQIKTTVKADPGKNVFLLTYGFSLEPL